MTGPVQAVDKGIAAGDEFLAPAGRSLRRGRIHRTGIRCVVCIPANAVSGQQALAVSSRLVGGDAWILDFLVLDALRHYRIVVAVFGARDGRRWSGADGGCQDH